MNVRIRERWEALPFLAKAMLLVLVLGVAVTATARAVTLGAQRDEPAPLTIHHLVVHSVARVVGPIPAVGPVVSARPHARSAPIEVDANVSRMARARGAHVARAVGRGDDPIHRLGRSIERATAIAPVHSALRTTMAMAPGEPSSVPALPLR
ncbi:MAG: hypothetical protein ACTHJM_07205 [Marmoricola sp.]